jgi:hypothetical protein|nr:MAG: hypothetical protein [Bacteriophage sp.]
MAKYLDLTGLKYFITKRIGKKDISKIGDGTCTGAISALNQSLGNLSNKQDWKEIGTFRDVNEHVISNIKSYRELRVNFMLYYSGSSYITRDYVFPVSESNNLEFLFLDGNYYDNNNYSSWCIVYNTIKNSIQNRSSWLRNVILGKDTTCQCVYRVYGR